MLGTGMIGKREDVVIAKAAGTAFGDPKALKRARPKSRVAVQFRNESAPPQPPPVFSSSLLLQLRLGFKYRNS
jgi:hypothetical protein